MRFLRLAWLWSLMVVASAASFDFELANSDLAYVAGSGAVPLDAAAALSGANFSGASSLTMSITSGMVAGEDLLQINAVGTVSVANGVVSVSGTPIGSYSGGGGGTALSVTIMPGSNATHVLTLVRALAYHNLAGSGASTTARIIKITVKDGTGAEEEEERTVVVGAGNAGPALTIGGTLTVPRSSRVAIGSSILLATDDDDAPDELRYQLGTLPLHGNLLLMDFDGSGNLTDSVVLGGNRTEFTQADINTGRLRYDHQGSTQASDSFTLRVRDSNGVATPLTVLNITITGTSTSPAITLPTGALTCTEQGPAVAMDPAAPGTTAVVIMDGDSPHYRRGELMVRLVDANGAAAGTAGDTIGVRAANGQMPSASQAGYICVIGSEIYIRHDGTSAAVLPSDGDVPSGNADPDQLLGTIDATDDGVAGRPLRIRFASTVVWQSADNGTDPDILASESEVVTPAAVAQLIANLQLSHPGDAPPAGPRFIAITLSDDAPTIVSGTAQRAVDVIPVNDPPAFTMAGPLTMSAVVGRPMIVTFLATDPDLPSGAALSYSQVNAPVPGLTLDPASGTVTWIPVDTSPAVLELVAQDEVAAGSPSLSVTITPLAGPTTAAPYVISDPPVELDEGGLIFHPFSIQPATSGMHAVSVQVVGDAPPGCDVESVSGDDLSWTLTAPSVPRPADGIYTFGLRVVVDGEIGYQPITLVVVGVSGSN